MNQITEADIDEAIKIAKAGGRDGKGYDQANWCGTSCCVLGWARIVAGLLDLNEGPREEEIVDTPRAKTLGRLMESGRRDILLVMEHVRDDGVIDLRGADLRMRNLRYADLSDADMRGANLTGADLRGAILRGTDLGGADLRNADLHNADLSGAKMSDVNSMWTSWAGST